MKLADDNAAFFIENIYPDIPINRNFKFEAAV